MLFRSLLLGSSLVGCADNSVLYQQMTGAYQAHRFAEARDKAVKLSDQSRGDIQEQAKYIAGISAYRLGLDDAALADLQPLARTSDATIAGPSAATCGIIYYERMQDSSAMRYLKIARTKVIGEDQARVYYHMGLIDQRTGRWTEARREMSRALDVTGDREFRKVIEQRMNARSFTLQFGAYLLVGALGRFEEKHPCMVVPPQCYQTN